MTRLPFNRPLRTGGEEARVAAALERGWTGGNGPASEHCQRLIRELTGTHRVLMTHSCTGALEMAALLADVGPGDEVIMPSFTFSSTANAFVLRGATPVFVDVEPETLNIDPGCVAAAITGATRAIVAVHYGGVGCDMASLAGLCREHRLVLIEDAAQGIGATVGGRALGAIGDLGTLSFHETKNVSCGEGGALLVNDEGWAQRAEILQEKGTNRQRFARGEVDRYTWVDVGSSFLMSDVSAALLGEQLERVAQITTARLELWNAYHDAFAQLEATGVLRRPTVPPGADHNAHLYRIMLGDRERRDAVIAALAADDVAAYFHYVPLHSAPAGLRFGRTHGALDVTDAAAERLVRLPLWVGMTLGDVARVAQGVASAT
ncbi:MAG TPA: dTDP-4-amino-4,6-dideoxygalactose transaminase [Solirubrobacteraceae bacterium]|jgi:dTDP-4-amino-4,6-dideoxygalactose transaminase|nr:dTDP-4-amino-4,6-dideoxygalactose transaminase [Solirubrobacteraceae bacterium]